MPRISQRAAAGAAACLAASPASAWGSAAADALVQASNQSNTNIFDPDHAPIIYLKIGVRRIALVPVSQGSSTTISSANIAQKANNSSFTNLIASSIAGAASSSSGDIHIRGSHGQYTYYLDGAPLPESVSGSFSDLIDPKNIEQLSVYTGGFPSRYGGNLAAVFDVTAKAGHVGSPRGSIQQEAQGYATYNSTIQAGGGSGPFSYFLSGVRKFTDRRLDPVTPNPQHDAGSDAVVFLHSDLRTNASNHIILDAAQTDALIQIPNTDREQANGRDDIQRENGRFENLIWRNSVGGNSLVTTLYDHTSRLRYTPSAADLIQDSPEDIPVATHEDRTVEYSGIRSDYTVVHGKTHTVQAGINGAAVTGHENFQLTPLTGAASIDSHDIGGNDQGIYLSDDWKPSRAWLIHYGARYDIHKASAKYEQLSPRLNVTYSASKTDKIHAYYDRLFEPAAIEDVRNLSAATDTPVTPIKPERASFYEVGWVHQHHGATFSLSSYYKTEQDVIDDEPLGNTQITIPINVEKGYVRGIEAAIDAPLTQKISAYANFARSWARAAGAISGGVADTGDPSSDYFPVDHDQLDTASVGLSYDHAGTFASLDGEYGSGFPYQDDSGVFRRVSPHFIFNCAIGGTVKNVQAAITVSNILNHGYVIKQAGTFTDQEYGAGRIYGARLTFSF